MDEFMGYEQNIQQQMPVSKKKKRAGLWILVICLTVCALAAAAFFLTGNLRAYAKARALYEAKDYQAAAVQFEALGDYEDASQMAQSAAYEWAGVLMDQRLYVQALEVLEKLGAYKDSDQQIQLCHYELGRDAMDVEDYEAAIEHFTQAQTTKSAPQRLKEAVYARGHELYWDGEYAQAQEYFDRLEGEWPRNGGPHFQKLEEALDYLQAQAEELADQVTVVVRDIPGTYIMTEGLLETVTQQYMSYQLADFFFDEQNQTITVKPGYYPGQKIVYAWKNADLSGLDKAELQAYEKALELVEQAREQALSEDPVDMELWLHDWICDNVVYDSPNMDVPDEEFVQLRELTCVGALLDGAANCQGYTDAFYVLGTMAGLDVCKVYGISEEEGHCWNGVRLDDWLYTVDVTFNDSLSEEYGENTYIWFNNALDLDEYTVFGGASQFYRMVTREDHSYTYYGRTDNVYEEFGDAVYQLLRQYRKNGPGIYHAVVDGAEWDHEDFYSAVSKNMTTAGVYSAQWSVMITPYLGDSYIFVEWM